MKVGEFHNTLRIMRELTLAELVQANVIPPNDELSFARFERDPTEYFIRASDVTAHRLWALITSKQPRYFVEAWQAQPMEETPVKPIVFRDMANCPMDGSDVYSWVRTVLRFEPYKNQPRDHVGQIAGRWQQRNHRGDYNNIPWQPDNWHAVDESVDTEKLLEIEHKA